MKYHFPITCKLIVQIHISISTLVELFNVQIHRTNNDVCIAGRSIQGIVGRLRQILGAMENLRSENLYVHKLARRPATLKTHCVDGWFLRAGYCKGCVRARAGTAPGALGISCRGVLSICGSAKLCCETCPAPIGSQLFLCMPLGPGHVVSGPFCPVVIGTNGIEIERTT